MILRHYPGVLRSRRGAPGRRPPPGEPALPAETPLRMVTLDYSGHPGQVQLSRLLAARGHRVSHLHCPGYASGKGDLARRADDPPGFAVRPVGATAAVRRYDPGARLRHEVGFAVAAYRAVAAQRPDVVLVSNVPLLALALLTRALRSRRIPYVFWQQDIYSRAMAGVVERRGGPLGRAAATVFEAVEAYVARRAAAVVAISEAFVGPLRRWGVPAARISVVGNWAPLAELPTRDRGNAWAQRHDLVGRPVALYAGTLGHKHDPAALLEVARALAVHRPDGRMVVVSEGQGRAWLAREGAGLPQLVLLDFQPYAELPDVLAAADVLLALLEPAAGAYSVPSKVLSYLCAGRPVVGVMPAVNGAAQMIEAAGAGVVLAGDAVGPAGVAAQVLGLLGDTERRGVMGHSARSYAETHFDTDTVATAFETVLVGAAGSRPAREGRPDA